MFGKHHTFRIETPTFTLTFRSEHSMANLTPETVAAITAQLNQAAQSIAAIPLITPIDDADLIAAANAVSAAVAAKTSA